MDHNDHAGDSTIRPAYAPLRIVYHPAPFPGPDGALHTPEPIDLGGDLRRATAWMRRRLSLYEAPAVVSYTSAPIEVAAPTPMTEPELAEATAQAAAVIEAYDAEAGLDELEELAAELGEEVMYDEAASDAPLHEEA